MPTQPDERRRFQRIDFDADTEISQGDQHWSAQLHDLSLKGVLVSRPEAWSGDSDQPFSLRITLDNGIELTMQGNLAHSDARFLGFDCQHIDLESICHLRRLVELNLGDRSLLERELGALIREQ